MDLLWSDQKGSTLPTATNSICDAEAKNGRREERGREEERVREREKEKQKEEKWKEEEEEKGEGDRGVTCLSMRLRSGGCVPRECYCSCR